MITILGTKITVFALYGLVSVQLLAIVLPCLGYKFRHSKAADGAAPVILFILGGFCEIFTIMWVASI